MEKNVRVEKEIMNRKRGGRRAVVISGEDLARKIETLHAKLNGVEPEEFNLDKDFEFAIGTLIEIPAVAKDLSKVSFEIDNWWTSPNRPLPPSYPEEGNLVGLRTLDNGLSFVGFICSGDNEEPLFMIVYWDGKSFRGYIPTGGNIWNTKLRCAFGAEEYSDYGPYGSRPAKGYEEIFERIVEDDDFDGLTDLMNQCYVELGYQEYGEGAKANWKLIEEDIRSRIHAS